MAETTRVITETSIEDTRPNFAPRKKTVELITVQSFRQTVLNVLALRDMVKALNLADIPGAAFVSALTDKDGHLVQLTVRRETEVVAPTGGDD